LNTQKTEKSHRILHVSQNVTGVMKQMNNLLGSYNVVSQSFATKSTIGYSIIDVDKNEFPEEILDEISKLSTTIAVRKAW
jgi:D-3-phosphoglycerate dehydrogenase / 2-oxoglutarate reductase